VSWHKGYLTGAEQEINSYFHVRPVFFRIFRIFAYFLSSSLVMGIYINKELKIYNPELALLPELTCNLPLDTS
jgi:hypothetical protein